MRVQQKIKRINNFGYPKLIFTRTIPTASSEQFESAVQACKTLGTEGKSIESGFLPGTQFDITDNYPKQG